MSNLKRYTVRGWECIYEPDSKGEWVRLEDAEDAIKAAVEAEREYIIENLLEEQLHWRNVSAIHHDLFSVVIEKIRARGKEPEHGN